MKDGIEASVAGERGGDTDLASTILDASDTKRRREVVVILRSFNSISG